LHTAPGSSGKYGQSPSRLALSMLARQIPPPPSRPPLLPTIGIPQHPQVGPPAGAVSAIASSTAPVKSPAARARARGVPTQSTVTVGSWLGSRLSWAPGAPEVSKWAGCERRDAGCGVREICTHGRYKTCDGRSHAEHSQHTFEEAQTEGASLQIPESSNSYCRRALQNV
jgi:hypothetical protein